MRKDDNCLSKGVYSHFQLSGYLTVKQYMIIEYEGKRCLLLRFKNEMKSRIKAIQFTVKQIDANRQTVKSVTVSYNDLDIGWGSLYSPEEGILLEDACEDFIVQMRYIISGNVKYVFKKDLVTEHYDVRGYDNYSTSSQSECKMSVKNNFLKKRRGYGWIAFLSFILLVLAVIALIYKG